MDEPLMLMFDRSRTNSNITSHAKVFLVQLEYELRHLFNLSIHCDHEIQILIIMSQIK